MSRVATNPETSSQVRHVWPLMSDFRFGVVWMGQSGTRAKRLPERLLACGGDGNRRMAVRFIQPNNDLQLRCGGHAASSTRLKVDFGDAPIRVEIYVSDETVEIFVEADFETHAEER